MLLGPWLAGAVLSADPSATALATPPLPATEDVLPRAAGEPTTLFVNFDGAVLQDGCGNDATRDCSTLGYLFDNYVGPFGGNHAQRASIMQATRKDTADFGIRVVAKRPPADDRYTMVLYGDLGEQSFAGIAPYIDCGDLRVGDTSFSQGYTSPNTGSTVILQEAAHTWGLEHVDNFIDTLNPFKTSANQKFTDECHKIVSNTDLDETSGACNQIHTMFCEAGFQNSYQEMLYLFGPPVPDTIAPTLELTSPEEGSKHALPVSLPLSGIIDDDYEPQIYSIKLIQDGNVLFEEENYALNLVLENPPEGEYELTVEIADGGGNTASDSVRFEILPEGSVVPGQDDTDSDSDSESDSGGESDEGCRVVVEADEYPGNPAALALLLLTLVPTRRRR